MGWRTLQLGTDCICLLIPAHFVFTLFFPSYLLLFSLSSCCVMTIIFLCVFLFLAHLSLFYHNKTKRANECLGTHLKKKNANSQQVVMIRVLFAEQQKRVRRTLFCFFYHLQHRIKIVSIPILLISPQILTVVPSSFLSSLPPHLSSDSYLSKK